VITVYGVLAVGFMMTMYAMERRGPRYVLLFALGCVLSSAYGFLSGAWPFGVVELVWSGVAVQRYRAERSTVAADRADVASSGVPGGPSSVDGTGRRTA
jgi:hypothetical protein